MIRQDYQLFFTGQVVPVAVQGPMVKLLPVMQQVKVIQIVGINFTMAHLLGPVIGINRLRSTVHLQPVITFRNRPCPEKPVNLLVY